jgi:hypothetical protein
VALSTTTKLEGPAMTANLCLAPCKVELKTEAGKDLSFKLFLKNPEVTITPLKGGSFAINSVVPVCLPIKEACGTKVKFSYNSETQKFDAVLLPTIKFGDFKVDGDVKLSKNYNFHLGLDHKLFTLRAHNAASENIQRLGLFVKSPKVDVGGTIAFDTKLLHELRFMAIAKFCPLTTSAIVKVKPDYSFQLRNVFCHKFSEGILRLAVVGGLDYNTKESKMAHCFCAGTEVKLNCGTAIKAVGCSKKIVKASASMKINDKVSLNIGGELKNLSLDVKTIEKAFSVGLTINE